jgi:Plant transposon protein
MEGDLEEALTADDNEEEAVTLVQAFEYCGERKRKACGSRPGKSPNKQRDFEGAYKRILAQYFVPSPLYDEVTFERRLRLPRNVFNRILNAIERSEYFQRTSDCTGKLGAYPLTKLISVLRVLANATSLDAQDEYCQLSESTVKLCLKAFIDVIETEFQEEFLRYPTTAELKYLMKRMSLRGFPGAWASIDCSHVTWKNCPTALQGQYRNKSGQCSIVTEVVCDENRRAWSVFVGMPGSLNDINVMDHSPMVQDIMCGMFPPRIDYKIRGTTREIPYLLADGIYPEWPIFAKTFVHPATEKEKLYSNMQESARKDVERIFGVVQTTWKVLSSPSSLWDQLEL